MHMLDSNAPQPGAYSFDVSAADFEQQVLLRSMEVPVLVDFWAPWCGPCKQLGPILEKLADEYAGGFVLAKVNTDEEMQVAAMFGIRSLPTVMLLKGARPIDGFMGVQPESAIRELLTHHGVQPGDGAQPMDEAGAGAAVALDPEEDVARLRAAVDAEPEREELKLDLAVALLRVGQADEAERLVDKVPAALAQDDRARRVKSQAELSRAIAGAASAADLHAAIERDPADLRARHLLGVRLLLEGRPDEGMDQFLEMLRRDRGYENELPKRALLQAFQVLDDEELVGRYRRKMASLLF